MADNAAAASSSSGAPPTPASSSSRAPPVTSSSSPATFINHDRPLHFFAGPARVEAYDGENSEMDQLAAMMQPPELPTLEQVLHEDGPAVAVAQGAMDQVEEERNLSQDLDTCLLRRKWEQALGVHDQMVHSGQAIVGAVDGNEADPRDIIRCHPELVVLLRGRHYVEMKERKDNVGAQIYCRDFISSVYPDNTSTGSCFADNLLERLRNPGARLRPQLNENTSRVWLLGEKQGYTVRCFACHKEFRGYDTSKFRYHLLHGGKQAKCPAVGHYISTLLKEIVLEDNLNSDGTSRKNPAQSLPAAAAAPAPLANANGEDAATMTPLPAVNQSSDSGPSAAPPLPAVVNGEDLSAVSGEDDGPSTAPPLPTVVNGEFLPVVINGEDLPAVNGEDDGPPLPTVSGDNDDGPSTAPPLPAVDGDGDGSTAAPPYTPAPLSAENNHNDT